jgi:hypothetical protein
MVLIRRASAVVMLAAAVLVGNYAYELHHRTAAMIGVVVVPIFLGGAIGLWFDRLMDGMTGGAVLGLIGIVYLVFVQLANG